MFEFSRRIFIFITLIIFIPGLVFLENKRAASTRYEQQPVGYTEAVPEIFYGSEPGGMRTDLTTQQSNLTNEGLLIRDKDRKQSGTYEHAF